MNTFMNIKPGDRVAFYATGFGLDARRKPIRRLVNAKVNPLLIFDTHVVAQYGSHGTVVDERNLAVVYPKKEG